LFTFTAISGIVSLQARLDGHQKIRNSIFAELGNMKIEEGEGYILLKNLRKNHQKSLHVTPKRPEFEGFSVHSNLPQN
jgi:hypothetical protein